MKKYLIGAATLLIALALVLSNFTYSPTAIALVENNSNSYYREKAIHNRDGIGKYYMKREIAQVMGHQAMMWLERPSREIEERPQQTIQTIVELELKPDDIVADIGAGTGYFSFRLASVVPKGKVYAVDIQPEMLDAIAKRREENKVTNVKTVLGQEDKPNLPENSIDLAFMVDKMTQKQVTKELAAVGLQWQETKQFLPEQHFLVFSKPLISRVNP